MSESAPAPSSAPSGRAWPLAARLLERWRARHERADALLESVPSDLTRPERARVQALLFGAIRHLGRIDAHLQQLMPRPPRTIVWSVLSLAGYELIEGGPEGHAARVGHHAVEQAKRLASPKEAGLVNAVVRRLAVALATEFEPDADASVEALARYFSHPVWLVQRWRDQFGPVAAHALLRWNQQPAPVFARWRARERSPGAAELEWLRPVADAPGFYEIAPGHWDSVQPLITTGVLHIQDPGTRLAVELLDPQSGESIVDLCAAPGGKSLAIADRVQQGRLVSVDLSGPRLARLEQNVARVPAGVTVTIIGGDLLRTGNRLFTARQLPVEHAAVLIDVPCSNTGVMRHRVDVKWRLQPADIRQHATQQFALLEAAAALVAPGGRLVYSTCSLEAEENEQVVDAFVRRSRGRFARADRRVSRPWETGHDGAAAFRLTRVG